ncbi:STAS domain-containing protein [Dethiosulfovibrio sp. F2B]|uniref:STAS domain-containing protein n=1 Tax=Dethiosulfovibrio faecalis TaxID=2720018 RepID=UPI001F45F1BD|nr:STAS domain-containing protein [Dethiosulfovibrio faecalis]MCF4151424.1 STAS domain-containing protein [Dethiosulfovibrio faecalis]
MKVDCVDVPKGKVVAVSGRLDTLTAPGFESSVLALLGDGIGAMVVDLSELEYISSAGLRSILAVAKKASTDGTTVSLCGMKGVVEEVFSISGFDSFLPVYPTRDEALEAM